MNDIAECFGSPTDEEIARRDGELREGSPLYDSSNCGVIDARDLIPEDTSRPSNLGMTGYQLRRMQQDRLYGGL